MDIFIQSKNYEKNLFSLVMLMAALLSGVSASAEIASGDGWNIDDEGLLTVTKNFDVWGYDDYPWFDYHESIKKVVFAEGVTSIGAYAFFKCDGLTSLVIPSTLTSISENAFSSCSGLESITVDGNNAKYDSRDNCNAIIEKLTNKLI